jgi:glycosyltransferase involved in cell wall biosynthesis
LDTEIAGFFQDAGIVVLPYLSASQSGVVAIAAAFARPVVATSVGGLPEQIEHGQTGLLIDPGSIKQLEEAVETLLRQPELGCRFGKDLAARNRENNNWDKIADAYMDSCRRAVSA